jgi:hypothetical protein
VSHYVNRHGRRIEVETIEIPGVTSRRRTEQFALVPLRWARRAVKNGGLMEFFVGVDLLHRAWKGKGQKLRHAKHEAREPEGKISGVARSGGGRTHHGRVAAR